MPEQGDFVRITNREIYDGLRGVERSVEALRTDMSNVLVENVELRKRVRGLELKFYAILAGLIGAVVVLVNIAGGIGNG